MVSLDFTSSMQVIISKYKENVVKLSMSDLQNQYKVFIINEIFVY